MPEQVVEAAISAVQKSKDTLVEALERVNPLIREHYKTWDDIDDVLEINLLRQFREVQTIRVDFKITPLLEGGTKLFPFHKQTKEREFIHLPRGSSEPWSEYQKRVRLTPFFPETPNIVDNRRGALFAKEPEIKVHKKIQPFLENIGPKRQSYREILEWLAWRTYAYGFVAVFVDFREVPDDVRARISAGEAISEQEVEERRLNQPVLGTFNERQILDFQFNKDDGRMDWIKLRTSFIDKKGWMDEGKEVQVFRIIDRTLVQTFEVRETDDGKKVTKKDTFVHEAINASGDPEVPVVLIRPFMGRDDIGQSPIRLSVIADLAAVRLISDITWNLYVHGCPLVMFTTPDTTGERAASLEWGCNRYLQLQSFPEASGMADEDMAYLQLDTAGTMLLIEQWEKMVSKANELASRTPPNSAEPVPMSGIAKQWDWKTGEEKALNEHMGALQMSSDDVLKMVSRVLINRGVVQGKVDIFEKEVRTSFDPSFEIGDPDFNVELHEKVISVGKAHKLKKMMLLALERIPNSIHNLKDTERREILDEIKELEAEDIAKPPAPPVPPIVPEEDKEEIITPEGVEKPSADEEE